MKKINIGLVGAGHIAANVHLPILSRLDNVNLVAIADIIEDRANEVAKKYQIKKAYTIYGEMLKNEELDCVFVLTEPDQLFRIALNCIEAGLDVFMEKPAGITSFQAKTLERASNEGKRILHVGLNRRYIPLMDRVKDIMQESGLNQINAYFVKHGDAAFYKGCASAFICDTIHAIDTLRWLSGSEMIKCATVEGKYNSVVPNAWNSVMLFENGITCTLQANYDTGGRAHGFSLYGDKASAYVNLGFGGKACEADILYYNGTSSFSMASENKANNQITHMDGIEIAGSNEYIDYYGYTAQDKDFLGSIITRTQTRGSISESVKSILLAEELLKNII